MCCTSRSPVSSRPDDRRANDTPERQRPSEDRCSLLRVSRRERCPACILATEPGAPDGFSYRQVLEVARREAITRALAQCQGNHTAAARALGIHKTHLLKLMKALRID